MIRHICFSEPAYISAYCPDGVVFSSNDVIPLDYKRPEDNVMARLNRWVDENPGKKIISIQGPIRKHLGDSGIVSLTLLYED